jgi:hypothetical protein
VPASPERGPIIGTDCVKANDGIQDGQGEATILDNDSNLAPVAANDAATTDTEVEKIIAVLTNDSDPDGDPLVVDSVGPTSVGGTVVINADNTIS